VRKVRKIKLCKFAYFLPNFLTSSLSSLTDLPVCVRQAIGRHGRNSTLNSKLSTILTSHFLLLTFLLIHLMTLHLFSLTLSTEKIAYCDVEKVFESYSLTELSRKQLRQEKEKMSQALKKLEKEIKEIKKKIEEKKNIMVSSFTVTSSSSNITSSTSTKNISISTMTLPGVSLEEELKKKEKELEEKKNIFKKELKDKEKDIREQIIYRIYTVIEEVANELGYSVVFDKSQVIYSVTTRDITDEVIKRLKEKFK